jgi:hypothetical protein
MDGVSRQVYSVPFFSDGCVPPSLPTPTSLASVVAVFSPPPPLLSLKIHHGWQALSSVHDTLAGSAAKGTIRAPKSLRLLPHHRVALPPHGWPRPSISAGVGKERGRNSSEP